MSGKLKNIVDVVKARTPLKNWAVAKLSIAVGQDVGRFTQETPDDPEIEAKLIEEAKNLLKTDTFEL